MGGRPTYDPMVGSQWRAPGGGPHPPLWPPPPGRALVLVPDSGPFVTVWPEQPLPASTLAAYQAAFVLDVTEHVLTLPFHLPCADAGLAFSREVVLLCRVADPALVVANGVRDVGSAVYGPVRDALAAVTCRHRAAAVAAADDAVARALADLTGDAAIRLRDAALAPESAGRPAQPYTAAAPRVLRGEVTSRTDAPPGPGGPPPHPSRVRGAEPHRPAAGGRTDTAAEGARVSRVRRGKGRAR